jgi:hypothetical protein
MRHLHILLPLLVFSPAAQSQTGTAPAGFTHQATLTIAKQSEGFQPKSYSGMVKACSRAGIPEIWTPQTGIVRARISCR